ncbi:MAG: acyltransferase family protein [Burkholderiaceae bacterium]
MTSLKTQATFRLTQVDGLRAVAALSVLFFHYTTRYEEVFVHTEALSWGLSKGYLGVNLFFVISGFVIFMTIDAARSPADFVFSRVTRLFPTFWAAVLLTWLLTRAIPLPGNVRTVPEMLANLTMLHESFGFASVDGAYWSLEVELIYYLWMLVLSATGALAFPRRVILVWLGLSTLAAVGAIAGLRVPWLAMHYGMLRWIPWFALGMLAYLGWRRPGHAQANQLCVGLALVTITISGGWLQLATAVAAYLAVSMAARGRLAIMAWRPLVAVGGISYPLYLVHEQLGWLLMLKMQAAGIRAGVTIAVALMASLGAAWLLSHWIEKPALSRTRRWWKTRQVNSTDQSLPPQRIFAVAGLAAILFLAGASRAVSQIRAKPGAPLESINAWTAQQEVSNCTVGPDTVVLLVLGQSNAASLAQSYGAEGQITVFREGRCGMTSDPLPGTSGGQSSIWTALIPMMVAAHPEWKVVVAPLAVGDTRASQWTQPGPLRAMLDDHVLALSLAGMKPDAILWQQGEADTLAGTEGKEYLTSLLRLREQLDAASFTAPLLVAKSSYCRGSGAGTVGRTINRYLVGGGESRVLVGPDTDSMGAATRYDGCHFSSDGRQGAANLWFKSLMPMLESLRRAR